MRFGINLLVNKAVVIGIIAILALVGVAGCDSPETTTDDPTVKDLVPDSGGCMPSAECDDGDPCTKDDECDDNSTCAGVPYVCEDDKECTSAVCAGDGECEFNILPGNCLISGICYADGELNPNNGCKECMTSVTKTEWSGDDTNVCDDGNLCVDGEYCDSGECIVGTEPIECNDDNACTEDSCDPKGGCVFAEVEGDCDDNDACTQDDSCIDGVCVGEAMDCDDANDCTEDSCDVETGCVNVPGTDPCDDDDACTEDDVCTEGECVGEVVDCDDANPCTDDSCNPLTGCANEPNTEPCSDENVCTISDVCIEAVCVGELLDCGDGNPCTDDLCDVVDGCHYENIPGECSDADVCTVGDFCANGDCSSGPELVDCDDENVCTVDSCDPIDGCLHTNNNELCDDMDACTVGDFCEGGSCQSGPTPLECVDENDCTSDECNSETGCINEPVPGPCNDKNACTVGDSCLNGACEPGSNTPNCDDADVCTDDSCDPLEGCVHVDNVEACNDGNECTDGDTCDAGQCVGSLITCNDENSCTNDSCDPFFQGGCVFKPNSNQCDDQDPCTLGDQCVDGDCISGVGKLKCDDGNECTNDKCTTGVGCEYPFKVSLCEDGNECTEDDYCANGNCVSGANICGCTDDDDCDEWVDANDFCKGKLHCSTDEFPYACEVEPGTAVVCNANLNTECSVQECVPATGVCEASAANSGNPCDDADPCTDNDICVAGECAGFDIPACGVGEPCAEDDDCITGLVCVTGMPGGYCVIENCDGLDCPDGSSCFSINQGQAHWCLKDCLDDGDCRTDDSHVCDEDDTCWCGPKICEPGEAVCNGDTATFCDPCGSGYVDGGKNCGDDGGHCIAGQCSELLCSSLSFDGEDDYVEIPNLDLGGTFTIEFWLNADILSLTKGTYLFSQLSVNVGDYQHLIFAFWKWIGIWWGNESVATETKVNGTTLPVEGKWTHVAATFDAQTFARKLWINGELRAATQVPAPFPSSQATKTYIGRYDNPMSAYLPFDGQIAWLRVSDTVRYSQAFSPSAHVSTDPSTMALYLFQDQNGTVLQDSSGNDYHGTIHGATWAVSGPGALCSSLVGSIDNPAISCKHILDQGGSFGDGIYWLDPDQDGNDSFQAYCDMDGDGGGWTCVAFMPTNAGDKTLKTSAAHATDNCVDMGGFCKLSDADINAMLAYGNGTDDRFRVEIANVTPPKTSNYYWNTTTPWSYDGKQDNWFQAATTHGGEHPPAACEHYASLGAGHYIGTEPCASSPQFGPVSTDEIFFVRTLDDKVGGWLLSGPFDWYCR